MSEATSTPNLRTSNAKTKAAKPPFLNSVRVKNFKAIRDSGEVALTPLTVFIGNNGSGKSCLVEGLETVQLMASEGLDKALAPWRGFEYARNMAVPCEFKRTEAGDEYATNPVAFEISGRGRSPWRWDENYTYRGLSEITAGPGFDTVFLLPGKARIPGERPRDIPLAGRGAVRRLGDRNDVGSPVRPRHHRLGPAPSRMGKRFATKKPPAVPS
jgi:hypothetical protein